MREKNPKFQFLAFYSCITPILLFSREVASVDGSKTDTNELEACTESKNKQNLKRNKRVIVSSTLAFFIITDILYIIYNKFLAIDKQHSEDALELC